MSQKRGLIPVVVWLTAHGVVADRLATKGFGMSQPMVDSTGSEQTIDRDLEIAAAP